MSWLFVPFLFQGAALFFDEFYYHRRRGLPLWERVGHPLDSLTVLACYLFLLAMPPSSQTLGAYIAVAAFSCLFVTKDEFVHTKVCTAGENWLHAVLFVLHPIALVIAGWMWWSNLDLFAIRLQAAIVAVFTIYQVAFWLLPWKKLRVKA